MRSRSPRQESLKKGKVLFALEGFYQVGTLVTYCIKAFQKIPKYELVIRTHSELPFSDILSMATNELVYNENIKLSEGTSLSADLNTSDMCIYWGSAVALEALSLGIPLIHFDMQTPLSYDPLLDFDALKWQVSFNDQLEDTIEEI